MARGARNTIESGNGGNPKWTDEERQTLMLLHKLWVLDDEQINTLFHRCYPQMSTTGRDYKYDHTRDEYRFRFRKGRSKRWHTIDRPNRHNRTAYTDEKNEELRIIQFSIEIAAAGGWGEDEITLNPRQNAQFPATNASNRTAAAAAAASVDQADEETTEDAGAGVEEAGVADAEERGEDVGVANDGVEDVIQGAVQEEDYPEEFFDYRPPGFFDEELGSYRITEAEDEAEGTAMVDAEEDVGQETAFPPRVFHIDQSEFLNQDDAGTQVEESAEGSESQEGEDQDIEEETEEEEIVAAPTPTRYSARLRAKRED